MTVYYFISNEKVVAPYGNFSELSHAAQMLAVSLANVYFLNMIDWLNLKLFKIYPVAPL